MTMPAGTYYIGDLCYVLKDPGEWNNFCDITINGNRCLHGEFTMGNKSFASYGTAYGDGCYEVEGANGSLGVDSGLIGCILLTDLGAAGLDRIEDGITVTFDEPFETGEDDGRIFFGHISINTSYDPDPDDDPWGDEDEDDS